MTSVPAVTPVTTPDELTVASAVAVLLQVPEAVGSLSAVVAPVHTEVVPVMADGGGLTVAVAVTEQIPSV